MKVYKLLKINEDEYHDNLQKKDETKKTAV
jgi:hypothetical protein